MAEEPLVLTVPEAAGLLSVGRNHIYSLIADGRLPAIRLGRAIRVPRRAVEQLIADAVPAGREGGDAT
jgi:excisionase family DNA binding protein